MAILKRLAITVDGASVRLARSLLGLAMAWEALRFFLNGWILPLFGPDVSHFSYVGFGWVRPWPGLGMEIEIAVLGLLGIGLAVGWRARLCSALMAVGWSHVLLIDQANYLNHLYLVVLLLVLFAWVPVRGGQVAGWGLSLLRLQVGLVYVFGGIAKLNVDWLDGQPMTYWMAQRADLPLVGSWLSAPGAGLALSWGGLVFDLLIVPALMWRRTRRLAFFTALLFHASNAYLFNIGIFPWLMVVLSTLFFEPSWPRQVLGPRLVDLGGERWGMGATLKLVITVWVLGQVLIPLRHWAYDGDVAWTEEGHHFSWRMKLRSKKGRVFFHILDRHSGAQSRVDPCQTLGLRQCRKMSTRPDMILQYAHRLQDERRAVGQELVAIHADAIGRLNQREPQRLIDPEVDLCSVERGTPISEWVVPLRAPLSGSGHTGPDGSGPRPR